MLEVTFAISRFPTNTGYCLVAIYERMWRRLVSSGLLVAVLVYTVAVLESRRRHLSRRVVGQFGAQVSQDNLSDCSGAEYVL
jgi:hypothetical protein